MSMNLLSLRMPSCGMFATACFVISLSSVARAEEVWDTPTSSISMFDYCEPWALRRVAGIPQTGLTADQVDSGDGGPAIQAGIPPGSFGAVGVALAVAPDGTIYLTSSANHVIRKISPNGTISLAVGQYGQQADYTVPDSFGDGGQALNAKLDAPSCVAVDNKGNLFIRDRVRVRKVAPNGIITTYAGTTPPPALTFTTQDLDTALADFRFKGPATQARLLRSAGFIPFRMVCSADGTLFLMEAVGILKITPDGVISPVVEAGRWSWFPSADVGEFSMTSIATNSKNELYAAGGQHAGIGAQPNILKIESDGKITKVLGSIVLNIASGFQSPVGPLTPDKPIHTYTLGFDARDRLWWSGGIDTTHFAHLDSDNVIRWSGMLQTHYAGLTSVEDGYAAYDIRTGPPDTFVAMPNGGFLMERFMQHPDGSLFVTLSALEPRVPQISPQLQVTSPSIDVTAKVGDPRFAVPVSIKNVGSQVGWYACKKNPADAWVGAWEVTFTAPGSGTGPTGIAPGQTLTHSLYIDPSKIFVPGVYHTHVTLYTLATPNAPITIPITLNLQPPAGNTNLAPAIVAGDNRGVLQFIEEDSQLSFELGGQDDGLPSVPGELTYSLASLPKHGTAVIQGTTLIYTPDPDFNTITQSGVSGYESFVWKVSDGALEASATINIYVKSINDAPTAQAGTDTNVTLPNAAQLAGSGSDVDGKWSDAYSMWISDPIEFRWSVVSGPGAVTFSDPIDPHASAAFSQTGSYVLRLTVSDGFVSGSDDVTITVLPSVNANVAPVAYNVSASTGDDDPADISFHITDDGLNNAPAFSIVAGPQHGTVNVNGSVAHYIPAPGYSGPDSFTYKANDGQFDSNVATVSVSVIPFNDPPTVDAGPDRTVQVGQAATLNGSATDLESDAIMATWSVDSGSGTVTFSDAGNLVTNATFTVAGTYVLKLTVSDGGWKVSDTVTVTVMATPPTNTAPVITVAASQSIFFPAAAHLPATVTDDGLPNPPGITAMAWGKISGPGTVTFSNRFGPVTDATFSAPGVYVVRLTAGDSALISTADVTVTVNVNHSPVVTSPVSADHNPAQTNQWILFSSTATDQEGDPLTYTWSFGDGGSASGTSVAHAFTAGGTYSVRCTVTDDKGGMASTALSVVITAPPPPNQIPVITAQAVAGPNPAYTAQTVTFSIKASDGDHDALSYVWDFGDGTIGNGSPATHAYAEAGTYAVVCTVSDGRGGIVASTVTLSVVTPPPPGNLPPEITSRATVDQNPLIVGQVASFLIAAEDPDDDELSFSWHFGDGTSGEGEAPTHAYAAVGAYSVICVVDDGQGGVTSSSLLVTVAATGQGGGASNSQAQVFTVSKLTGAIKFGVSAHDSCQISGSIPGVPQAFNPAGVEVSVDIGGAARSFVLDAKGRAKTADGTFQLKLKRGKAAKGAKPAFLGGNVAFQAKITHGTWTAEWADEGLDANTTLKNAPFTLDVTMMVDSVTYEASVTTLLSSNSKGAKFLKK